MFCLDMLLNRKDYTMPLLKPCAVCGTLYKCRKDKFKTSRLCSKKCQYVFMGFSSGERRHEKWAQETREQTLEAMRNKFEEFFKKSSDDSCWLWKKKNGNSISDYANFTFRSERYKSNRAAWLIYRGEIPKDMYVLHKCDIRFCVNPDHLFLGTHVDNMHDMKLKKRAKPRCKLSPEQVTEVREMLNLGVTTTRLAKKYNVSSTCIWYIKHNKSWKD